ncbi:MAG: DUF2335 domain-containing protein [Capsulimonadaceae bacterium]
MPNSPEVTAEQLELKWISGPVPSADELARYEAVLPGAAERFFTYHDRQIALIEKQVDNRIGLERAVVTGDSARATLGVLAGVAIAFCGIWAAYQLGMHGHDWLAGGVFLGDIGGMAGVFVYGTRSRRAERAQQLNALVKDERQNNESS